LANHPGEGAGGPSGEGRRRLAAGLTFTNWLPAAGVAELPEERGRSLDAAIGAARARLSEVRAQGLARTLLIEFEYGLSIQEAERRWVRGLAHDLLAGNLRWPEAEPAC
jgi:hypothetical protein